MKKCDADFDFECIYVRKKGFCPLTPSERADCCPRNKVMVKEK